MGRKINKLTLLLSLMGLGLLVACSPKISDGLAEDLKEIEMEDVLNTNEGQERIGEIRGFIAKEQNEALKVINNSSNRSRFLRMLGLQYMNLGMFGEAYNAFTEARLISPTNTLLVYYQAVSSANVQKNMVKGTVEKEKYVEIAKNAYALALDLRPDFKEALYGSAVFYAYELGDLPRSLTFVNRLVAIDPKNASAWVLKGQIHAGQGEREQAVFAYNEAMKQSSPEDQEQINTLLGNVNL